MNASKRSAAAPRRPPGRPKGESRSTQRAVGPATESAELEPVFAAVARYFGLLSEPTRIKILHAICQSERSVGEIVEATGATQTNVSRHLALLHQAGVVGRRREGNTVHYQVADAMFADLCRTVCVQIAGRIDAREPLKKSLLGFAAQHERA